MGGYFCNHAVDGTPIGERSLHSLAACCERVNQSLVRMKLSIVSNHDDKTSLICSDKQTYYSAVQATNECFER